MKTYLVTGGAGFIGSHLCERLLLEGHRVVNLDHFHDFYDIGMKLRNVLESAGLSQPIPPGDKKVRLRYLSTLVNSDQYKLEAADIRDAGALDAVFSRERVDAVIHLAALAGVRPSVENPLAYADVNVTGTLTLLEAMRKHGVRKWICASSSSVYGSQPKAPFSEEDPVDFAISPYAATKKSCEVLGYTYHHLYGIDTMMLRFFTVYGERQRPDLAIHKFTRLIDNGLPVPFYGDGSTQRDYTYVGDIMDGVLKSIRYVEERENVYEILNLGESHTVSLKTLVEMLERELGKPALLKHLPPQPGDVPRTYADISKAKRLIGYDPRTTFLEGLRLFIKWYKG